MRSSVYGELFTRNEQTNQIFYYLNVTTYKKILWIYLILL